MPIFLPADTRATLGEGANRCESIALLQQKFPFIDPDGVIKQHHRVALDLFLNNGPADLEQLRRNARTEANNQNPRRAASGAAMATALDSILPRTTASAIQLNVAWLEAIPKTHRRQLTLTTASRLIVGHANGVIENSGLTLHRTHGFPLIPGSAVKNVALRASLQGYDYSDADRNDLFGSQSFASRISYLDAVPAEGTTPILEFDISTPHYPDYYSGNRRNPNALDTENPVPVVFPAVAAGSSFTFTVVLHRPTGDANRDAYLLDQAEVLLHEGLTTLGVGAKTASGHGYFNPDLEQFEPSTTGHTVVFRLLTPAITAGANQAHPELRVASIRGQLRQIYRMLGATPTEEHALFGGIGRNLPPQDPKHNLPVASAISLRLERITGGAQKVSTALCPHDRRKGERAAIPGGTTYKLVWRDRFATCDRQAAAARARVFSRVLRTWLLLGSVGCRSTRAAGSVAMINPQDRSTIAFQPGQFNELLGPLNLPDTLRVAVLGEPKQNPEELRAIATDTVNGTGRGTIRGDALGFVGNGRKVSPLKLKVGYFTDGYRLIAIWDNRHGRGGDLNDAIRMLNQRNKALGGLLSACSLNHA